MGLGFLVSERYLFAFTSALLLISVGALAFRAKGRRGYGPAVVGFAAAAVILVSKFSLGSTNAMYGGIGLLIAASVWNSWPRRMRAPSVGPLVQLSERIEQR
jgi:O-antigen ligase